MNNSTSTPEERQMQRDKEKLAAELGYSAFEISRLEQIGEKLRAGKIVDVRGEHILEYKIYEDKIFNQKLDMLAKAYGNYYGEKEAKKQVEKVEFQPKKKPGMRL